MQLQSSPFRVELGLIGCSDDLVDPNRSQGSFLSFAFLFSYDFLNIKRTVHEYEKGVKEQKCDFKKGLSLLVSGMEDLQTFFRAKLWYSSTN